MRTNWKLNLFMCMALLVASSIPAMAENRKGVIYRIKGTDNWAAAIEKKYFEPYKARQEKDNWCWAASAQMVLNYQGITIDQESIVKRIYEDLRDEPANIIQMAKAVDGWTKRTETDCFTIRVKYEQYLNPYAENYRSSVNAQGIINDLVDKYPLLVGLANIDPYTGEIYRGAVGHAWVITGLMFRRDENNVLPYEVILRDPSPYSPSRQTITWKEFKTRLWDIIHVFPVKNENCKK